MINIFRKSNTANQEQTSKALSKSKQNWFSKIPSLFSKPNLSEEEFELLEEILLSADVGYSSTINIIEQVRSRLTNPSRDNSQTSIQILKDILIESLSFDINWNLFKWSTKISEDKVISFLNFFLLKRFLLLF